MAAVSVTFNLPEDQTIVRVITVQTGPKGATHLQVHGQHLVGITPERFAYLLRNLADLVETEALPTEEGQHG